METEIELKYLVGANDVDKDISQLFDVHAMPYEKKTKSLINNYFDTDDLALRQLDMGLRIRTYPDYREQTIKTAGVVIGGLHKRPEYNVKLNDLQPQLALFPESIWPENYNLLSLEQALKTIFSTNFERTTWLIQHAQGRVELAYDKGTIASGSHSTQINEIELELLEGEVVALFDIAKMLFSALTLTPGRKSKAARGYALWKNSGAAQDTLIERAETGEKRYLLVPSSIGMTNSDLFYQGMALGLEHLQESISRYLHDSQLSYLFSIREAMQMLSYGISAFKHVADDQQLTSIKHQLDDLITHLSWLDKAQHVQDLTLKSGGYRKKIEYNNQLIELLRLKRDSFPNEKVIKQQLQDVDFNTVQLDLLALIIEERKTNDDTDCSLLAFDSLEQGLNELIHAMPDNEVFSAAQYLELKPFLSKTLLTGSWFGGLYDESVRKEYRNPWLDILHGIDELEIFALLQRQLQQLEAQPEKLIAWLDGKIENLVDALEYSRKVATSVTPYWRLV